MTDDAARVRALADAVGTQRDRILDVTQARIAVMGRARSPGSEGRQSRSEQT